MRSLSSHQASSSDDLLQLLEPYRSKVVEPLPLTTREQREIALEEAGYNLFNLHGSDVTIDLLTDSGTGALSARQQAEAMAADETYAGAESFYRFRQAASELTSYPYLFPVHQGRAAERVLFGCLLQPGQITVSNTHFDTTRANVELTGCTAIDLPSPQSHDLDSADPFKGNIDIEALTRMLEGPDGGQIALVIMTITNNGVAGQPASMANLRAASDLCRQHRVPFFLDAARFAENAWLVTQNEPGYQDRSPREVAQLAFSLADGCVASLKKDGIANTGGLLGLRDHDLAGRCETLLTATEGFRTYGGLAGRDLEMLAQGLTEVTSPHYLRARARATATLAGLAHDAGVESVRPTGVHAVYLNAARLFPHIPAAHFPGHALACELYLEGGIRSWELGTLYLGHDNGDGELTTTAPYELTRLAIPRRVYTSNHFEYVGAVLSRIAKRASQVPGYRLTEAPAVLRHFNCRLKPVPLGD